MKRIIIEKEKCDGCLNCSVACMQAHRTDSGTVYDLNLGDPANESRNFIKGGSYVGYTPLFCRHCDDPKCVVSCMSGAMSKDTASGLVLYDEEQCASCFMCVMNCPFGILKPDRKSGTKVIKCDFCQTDPEGPGCVRSCPRGAIHVEEVQ